MHDSSPHKLFNALAGPIYTSARSLRAPGAGPFVLFTNSGTTWSPATHGYKSIRVWLYWDLAQPQIVPSMIEQMDPDHFIFYLAAALKSSDIVSQLKQITLPNRDEFADLFSSELYKQLKPIKDELQANDQEIKLLKRTIAEQNDKWDQLEQHGRCDSLRISGIPVVEESDDTDAAVITPCAAIKVDPPVQPDDIAVSHRVDKAAEGKPLPVLVKLATRNIRERVFRAKKTNIKTEREKNESPKHIYINEDLTRLRANLARKARSCRNDGHIQDTWTIYGKVMVKDLHGHIKIVNNEGELQNIAQN